MDESLRKRFMEGKELTADEQETVSNWMYARGADLREIHQIADPRERYEELCQFLCKEPMDEPEGGLEVFRQRVPNEWSPRDQAEQKRVRLANIKTLIEAGWTNYHITYRIPVSYSHVVNLRADMVQNAGSYQ